MGRERRPPERHRRDAYGGGCGCCHRKELPVFFETETASIDATTSDIWGFYKKVPPLVFDGIGECESSNFTSKIAAGDDESFPKYRVPKPGIAARAAPTKPRRCTKTRRHDDRTWFAMYDT